MKVLQSSSIVILGLVISGLTACSKADVDVKSAVETVAEKAAQTSPGFDYIAMEGFSHDLAQFVGLTEGESFAQSEAKINYVFKAYDGHEEPIDIRMDSTVVDAGWKQVLVTQDGLMDGTVTGQQLLAIFDEDKKLISFGMRIKCHAENGSSDWQKHICE